MEPQEWIYTPESSNIVKFGYDSNNGTLYVEFKRGTQYCYYDIPYDIFEEMKSAPSKGQFLAYTIKGAYRYARL